MSEPPKKIRNRNQDVQLVVSCDAPKVDVAEGRSTSVYEIDIQGGYDLVRGDRRESQEKDPKEPSTKQPGKELRGACQENAKEEVEGHVEAHYPKVMETFSDQRPSRTQNGSFTVQGDILTDGNKEKDIKAFMGKANKKRQAMPTDAKQKFRKQIKNYIIESFIGDKCTEMKSMVQNYDGVLDGNEVHLHHHEHHHHHHHYYTNGKALDGETNPQRPIQEKSPKIFVTTVTASANGAAVEHRELEVEGSDRSRGPHPAQAPGPTEETDEERGCPLAQENPEESDALLLENGSSAFVKRISPKNEDNSTSSLKSRTGEADMIFIKNPECSLDSVMMENAETQGVKEANSKTSKSYASLMENFKSYNHFTTPVVITDQKTVPKILYIRCECSPWKGKGSTEEVEAFQNKYSEGKDDPERKTDDGEDNNRPETEQSMNYTSNQCQGVEEESAEELAFDVWTSRLKKELQEIKKELKRIEEKQVLEKRSTNTSFRKEKLNESGSDEKITVYSSKTFIMQPPQDAAADV